MIHVNRDSVDRNGRPIRPNDAWFRRAAIATNTAIQEQGAHEIVESIYKHTQVRTALERLFHDKCAYCEWKVASGTDWDVDHFRPKGRVAERENHPGYYWLTYTWTNLYPSCIYCNESRKDKPRWADPSELPAAGKYDQFPLGDESTRVMSPDGLNDLVAEDALLLDPCKDHPSNTFDLTWAKCFSQRRSP